MYIQSLGVTERAQVAIWSGVISGSAALTMAVLAPVWGVLADRYGRKPFMLLGPVFGAIAAQLMGLTMLIPVLVLVRILQGLSTATSAPATLGFLSAQTATSEKLRGRVMGFYEAATVVGLAIGAALAGKLHDEFGPVAFTIVALLYVVAFVPFVFLSDRAWVPRVKLGQNQYPFRLMGHGPYHTPLLEDVAATGDIGDIRQHRPQRRPPGNGAALVAAGPLQPRIGPCQRLDQFLC